jgi:hypothetical protein
VSAVEVIAQEVWQAYVVELGRSMPEGLADKLAAVVVPALKAAGYAVVELPEDPHPFSVGLDGDVWDDDLNESYSPAEARIMATRLLAAADAAERAL